MARDDHPPAPLHQSHRGLPRPPFQRVALVLQGGSALGSYQAGAYQKDDGIRIDHLLLSPQAADRLIDAGVDRHVRGWDKPSDHVPVYIDLDIAAR